MNILKSEDDLSYKFQHDDQSETTIKLISGCTDYEDESKFTVFISTSVGCNIGCEFCYLNHSDLKYRELINFEVINNTLEAIQFVINENPHLKTKYVKLSWMGMGDAFLDLAKVELVSKWVLDSLLRDKLVQGLDCIDISTTMPKLVDVEIIKSLKDKFNNYPRNPNRKSPLRIFYSLISCNPATRRKVIPGKYDGNEPFDTLIKYSQVVPVLFHNILLNEVNDKMLDLIYTVDVLNEDFKDCELRILRFNKHPKCKIEESRVFNTAVAYIEKHAKFNLKLQKSPGKDIKGSCGQFLV